jgi:cobalamin biosynthesis protein CbiG
MSRIAAVITTVRGLAFSAGIGPPPVPPDDSQLPYITVQEIMNTEIESMYGPSGLVRTVIQLSVHSKNYSESWSIREACKKALINPTSVQFIQDHELYDGERSLHQHVARFNVWGESAIA